MITWNEITEELGTHAGFRQALVSVFRKYEGQETDERDGSNRIVKVTAASFARHFGIPKNTFNDWINPPAPREVGTVSVPTSPEPAENPSQPEPEGLRHAPQVEPAEPRSEPRSEPVHIETVFSPVADVLALGKIKAEYATITKNFVELFNRFKDQYDQDEEDRESTKKLAEETITIMEAQLEWAKAVVRGEATLTDEELQKFFNN